MKIEFEKRIFKVKSLLLVLFSMLLWGLVASLYGRFQDAELMGMLFGFILGFLFTLQYIQLFKLILKKLFPLKEYDISLNIKKKTEVYTVKSKTAYSISFATFYTNYILISEKCLEDEIVFNTMLDYEKTRLERGIGIFNTMYLWCIAAIPIFLEYILFISTRKYVLRYFFSFLGNMFRILFYPFLFIVNILLYSKNIYTQNDHLTSLRTRNTEGLIHTFKYLYSQHPSKEFIYFPLMPLLFTGPSTFSTIQKLWSSQYLELEERIRFIKNIIG